VSINRNISRVLALSQLVQTYDRENRSDYAAADQPVKAGAIGSVATVVVVSPDPEVVVVVGGTGSGCTSRAPISD
jgi:hypothetical protein